ncbi:MAG: LysE family transporter [Thermodesulfobacteriota bacterium]|nr:LysE family transporter [Thermodesulfobacteriota bacterium]
MEKLAAIFISSFIIAMSGAMMPGPVLTVTISESTKRGFLAGPLIVLGHGILEISLLVFLVLGFADLINNPKFLGVVGIAGGIVLLWLSFGMLKGIKQLRLDFTPGKSAWGGPVIAGILTSLANPYWIIWWATIGLSYVIISMKFGFIGLAVFFTGHILADLLWYSTVSLLVSRGKKYISTKIYRGIIGSCAIVLIFFGIYFGVSGIRCFI